MTHVHRRWEGETVAIVASGPSLTQSDCDLLRGRVRVIAVNDSWRLCPWADMLYAADPRWWRYHTYATEFEGERWTQNQGPRGWLDEAEAWGITVVTSKHKSTGLSLDPSYVHTGWNSGFQAFNIAVLSGATEILLLGIDLALLDGKRHWFGNHQGTLNRESPYDRFRAAFEESVPQLDQLSINVVNCSLRSSLTCFERRPLAACQHPVTHEFTLPRPSLPDGASSAWLHAD